MGKEAVGGGLQTLTADETINMGTEPSPRRQKYIQPKTPSTPILPIRLNRHRTNRLSADARCIWATAEMS